MAALASSTVVRPADHGVRRAGVWCLAGGLLGVVQAAALLAWPHQVSESMFRYPMTTGWFITAQLSFAAQHMMLLAGVIALLRITAVNSSRTARVAVTAAAIGVALLTVLELVAIVAYDEAEHSSRANLLNDAYSVPVLLIGVGLVVAGFVAVRRRSMWIGATWLPWLLLALGVYVFVPLSWAITASFAAGRLGIGGWMVLFATLGYGLIRLDPAATSARHD
ncbi:MAG TPA: hypothetical protein VMI11_14265 [Actinomycetes bacterium]|nr:hypothetical protein [Actinomycetes bacterium]